ncbi:MAG: N-acetyltransferase family protein [Fusobacteriota bacterium]
MNIRKMEEKDLKKVMDIYNEQIKNSTATFNIEEREMVDQKRWFEEHNDNYPVFIMEIDKKVIGWSALSKWSDREAYQNTAELSIYFEKESRGKGYGKTLMEYTLKKSRETNLHTIISLITGDNKISIKIHEKYDFKKVGVMKEVGRKFGEYLDVMIMQKMI